MYGLRLCSHVRPQTPVTYEQDNRAVSGQDHPTEPDDLAISKLARATIASA